MSDAAELRQLEFWFDFASTYSFLSAHRIEMLARTASVELVWRPFLLGPIFSGQGWSNSPFELYPSKGRHMWRDLERRAAIHGLAVRRPSRFPRNGLLAARLALVGLSEGWGPPFVRSVFEAEFMDDLDIADRDALHRYVARAGGDPEETLAAAGSAEIKAALRANTETAAARGVFGAPTFVARGELFWGDDRLEEALLWALGRHPGQAEPIGAAR